MTHELPSGDKLIEALFAEAAQGGDENWGRIDAEIIPGLAQVDGNQAAKALLSRVGDDDPNIRDAVATGLGGITIADPDLLRRSVEAMTQMATEDPEEFPSGRAAAFLMHHRGDEKYGDSVKSALDFFVERARENWSVSELTKNIPDLEELFLPY